MQSTSKARIVNYDYYILLKINFKIQFTNAYKIYIKIWIIIQQNQQFNLIYIVLLLKKLL